MTPRNIDNTTQKKQHNCSIALYHYAKVQNMQKSKTDKKQTAKIHESQQIIEQLQNQQHHHSEDMTNSKENDSASGISDSALT